MKYFDIWLGSAYLRTCLADNKEDALALARAMFGPEATVQEVSE